jgi:GNAT superfamily N-acetyltransferase
VSEVGEDPLSPDGEGLRRPWFCRGLRLRQSWGRQLLLRGGTVHTAVEMSAVAVRWVRLDDVEQLARPLDQLGHPQTAAGLRAALEDVLADPRSDVLVAEGNGALLGAAAYFMVPVAHDSRSWCRITTLVVDEAHCGGGIGQMLVEAAETAARDAACSRIEATSALHRTGAHRLYERLGYGRTSAHFLKRL